MGLIKNSKCFIGTSLHGIITAMSFGIPYLCINNKQKLKNYIKDWDYKNFQNQPFCTDFINVFFSSEFFIGDFELQKELIRKNFKRIEEILNG